MNRFRSCHRGHARRRRRHLPDEFHTTILIHLKVSLDFFVALRIFITNLGANEWPRQIHSEFQFAACVFFHNTIFRWVILRYIVSMSPIRRTQFVNIVKYFGMWFPSANEEFQRNEKSNEQKRNRKPTWLRNIHDFSRQFHRSNGRLSCDSRAIMISWTQRIFFLHISVGGISIWRWSNAEN